MARPSPRTQGITPEGETFQKYGTQQLVKDPTTVTGVRQVDTGATFKGFTTAPFQAIKQLTGLQTGTVFSQRIISGQTGATPVGASYVPPTSQPTGETVGTGKCVEDNPFCGFEEVLTGQPAGSICKCPNWFGWDKEQPTPTPTQPQPTCTTCDSDKCQECNAWDVGCELGHMMGGTCTPPPKPPPFVGQSWWNKYQWIVYAVLAVAGIGILLWLLRPLFELIGLYKRGAP